MKDSLLTILNCPDCRGPFTLSKARREGAEIIEGELHCPNCDLTYPVVGGVPVILRVDARSNRTRVAFGRQWALHGQGRFESETLYGKNEEELLRDFEVAFDIPDLEQLTNQLILDAGCGSGQLTASIGKIASNSTVVGFDFGDAARLAHHRCKELANVHILQCDLTKAPFRPETFDYVWSMGVLHHTPETARSFDSLSKLAKEGGKLHIWIYSSRVFTPYRFARKILHKPYLIPAPALYLLSWGLAVPVYSIHKMREITGMTKIRHRLDSIAFSFHDTLSPEFMHYHSKEEVRDWFLLQGYQQPRFLAQTQDIGATGTKKERASAKTKLSPV